MTYSLDDPQFSDALRGIVESYLQKRLPALVPGIQYGIAADDADLEQRTVDVGDGAGSIIAPGVPYDGPLAPVKGDVIRFWRLPSSPRNDRFAQVIRRDFAASLAEGLPDSIVYQEELDAAIADHAAEPLHLIQYHTPNTFSTDAGTWSKIATGSIFDRYGEVSSTVMINGAGANGLTWSRGTLRFRIRQQSAFGVDPLVMAELLDAGDVAPGDFTIRVSSNAGPTKYQVFARVTRDYEWMVYTPMWLHQSATTQHEWKQCSDFAAMPGGGTLFVAVAA